MVLPAAALLAACSGTDGAPTSPREVDALPDDIVRALQTDERVLDCAEGTRDGRSAFAADWVRATRVDLDDDGRRDWLVEGLHRCVRRDGRADWWIYADDGRSRRLIGTRRSADRVAPLPTRTRGFADLEVDAHGETQVLRFAGDGYR